jgi:hypothetical protein
VLTDIAEVVHAESVLAQNVALNFSNCGWNRPVTTDGATGGGCGSDDTNSTDCRTVVASSSMHIAPGDGCAPGGKHSTEFGTVECRVLDWNDSTTEILADEKYDVIIAADVLYSWCPKGVYVATGSCSFYGGRAAC